MTGDRRESRPPRGWLRLLLDPQFGSYLLGRTVSSAGVWVHNIVSALLVYQLTSSALLVGLVSAVQFLPQLVLAPMSGSFADRGNRKRQVILGRLIVTFGSVLAGVCVYCSPADPYLQATIIIVSAGVVGLGFVVGGPAMHALVPSLVKPKELSAAVTLNLAPVTLARAGGPALGAATALSAGPVAAFCVAAAANASFAVVLGIMRVDEGRRASQRAPMRELWRFVRSHPSIKMLLTGVVAVGFATDPAVTLSPSLTESQGYGQEVVGLFTSAFGVGSAVGFVVIAVIRPFMNGAARGPLGLWIMALGMLSLSTSWWLLWTVFAWFVAGVGMTLALSSLSAQLQLQTPDALRGRVMAVWAMCFMGARPLAAAINGAVADLVSVRAAFMVVGLLVAVVAVVCRPKKG